MTRRCTEPLPACGSLPKSAHRAGVSASFTSIGLTIHSGRPAKAGGLPPVPGPGLHSRLAQGIRTDEGNENGTRIRGNKRSMNPSERIDQLIAELTDWRGKTLASLRKSILEADREIIEEWKWMGSPVWSRDGMIAVGNAHKDKVKLTFSHGAKLADPDKLFNAGLDGKVWRAIDLFEGDKLDERALKNLVRAAIDYNQAKRKSKAPARARSTAAKAAK